MHAIERILYAPSQAVVEYESTVSGYGRRCGDHEQDALELKMGLLHHWSRFAVVARSMEESIDRSEGRVMG